MPWFGLASAPVWTQPERDRWFVLINEERCHVLLPLAPSPLQLRAALMLSVQL